MEVTARAILANVQNPDVIIQLNIGDRISKVANTIQQVKNRISFSLQCDSNSTNVKQAGIRQHAIATTKVEAADDIIKETHKNTPSARATMLGLIPVFYLTIFSDQFLSRTSSFSIFTIQLSCSAISLLNQYQLITYSKNNGDKSDADYKRFQIKDNQTLNLQLSMSNVPFIIKNKVMQTMVPADSEIYDQNQESRIQVVQAINGYLTINMLYEGFKLMWSYWHYQIECPDFAYLSLGFTILNFIWGATSYYGFSSIRGKNSKRVNIFSFLTIANLVLRIIMYIICGVVMKGYVPNYIDISEQQKLKVICSAVYPEALYVIQGIFQALVCLILIFLTRSIVVYIHKWQNNESQKFNTNKYNLADY